MSAPNDEAQAGQGEFAARVPASEPLTTKGHQAGRLTTEADKAPEFHAEVLPAGTAPPEHTFEPNNTSDAPAAGAVKGGETASASSTIAGATSGDVHTGIGKPGVGQSSAELRHDGKSHRANERSGLEGTAATGAKAQGL